MKKPVIIIGGPTASGKSSLALAIAEAFSGVVINADSMQIYAGLPILTAQPSAEDKARVPHALYGVMQPDEVCSAVIWRDMAIAEIRRVHALGKLPVIVGGTGFYIKTLTKGISPIPEIAPDVRGKLSALQKEMGNPAFHEAFAKRDPAMAAKLDPFNTQRVVRAWEVLEGTGKSLSEWQAAPPEGVPEDIAFSSIFLLPPRDVLYAVCNMRFGQMMAMGALEEARDFKKICPAKAPLAKALGYPELVAYLDGQISLDDATVQAQQSTRNYAKRQVTWFSNQIAADLILETPTPPLAWVEKTIS